MERQDNRVPVTLLTGFLGAGKTTLLNHLIRDPDAGRIAVVMNEFGDVGLDHDLIEEATDWAKHGINCNAIAPGYFDTPLNAALVADPEFSAWLEKRTPAGRWGKIEELVGAAVFLSSPASSFVNGHTLFVDGGITACL